MKRSVVVGVLALLIGIAGGWGMRSYLYTHPVQGSSDSGDQLRATVKSVADSSLVDHDYRIFKVTWNDASGVASLAVDEKSLCLMDLKKDQRSGQWQATRMQCRKAKNKAELQSGWTATVIASGSW